MMGRSYFLFVIVILQVFHASPCVHGKEPESLGFIRCKKDEQQALLKFKQSFSKDPMNRLSSWVGEDCCQWHGVTCDNVTHNVVKLNLRTVFASCLPYPQVSMLSSGLSLALLELKNLTHLDLSGNDFSGSRIPEFIGSLRHLSEQNLYGKALGWASGLLKLQSFDMSGHNLYQAHDTIKVLSTLPSLSALSLSNCALHNSHLSEALISNTSNTYFPTLQHLDLRSNDFEGPLPSIFKSMLSLQSLSLRDNSFSGSVPLWLRAMGRLEVLDLSKNICFNYVEGGIMGIMGNPCNFKYLDLSENCLTQGDILEPSMSLSGCSAFDLEYLGLGGYWMNMSSSLPSSLGQLTNLYHLDLSYNKFKGGVPASFVNLTSLKYLDLSKNMLNGTIPDFIGHLTQIEHLDISSNSLQGTVFGIGNLSKLSYLDMNYNNLNLNLDQNLNWRPSFQLSVFNAHSCVINTVFPQWLKNQTWIESLDLSYTRISGELPKWLWNSSYLEQLHLSGNRLTGSLPQHDGPNLELLDLHNNFLTGTIPKWLGQHPIAAVIDLSSNLLSGTISDGNNASSLFNFDFEFNLWMLDLSDNMLSGEIQFGKPLFPNNQLKVLSLRGNHFNGPIPSQLCDFGSLLVLELGENHFTGHIPPCLGSIPFTRTDAVISDISLQIEEIIKGIVEVTTGTKEGLSIIDLSSNYLVGTIPEELTNISALFALNLSYNHLTGYIPENIGNLKTVESLDLSNNHLSGTIPQSLASISWLSKLNLSNNNLHGPIPKGSQLQTLDDPSIYANNSGLCEFPLPSCTKPEPPPSSTNVNPTTGKHHVDKEDKYEKLWFILAVMSGVATGFWGVVGTLVIKRSWREAYFRYVEELGDRIYVPVKVRVNRFKRKFNENS
ncbi:receptor-like protein EIX2 isoform X2 [Silene latifolia]|uniref:receptor-like protein EIX2 isoform X2 n=1 Tax=Silene latifolia TaxID=37657 RepID=UPI003D77753F